MVRQEGGWREELGRRNAGRDSKRELFLEEGKSDFTPSSVSSCLFLYSFSHLPSHPFSPFCFSEGASIRTHAWLNTVNTWGPYRIIMVSVDVRQFIWWSRIVISWPVYKRSFGDLTIFKEPRDLSATFSNFFLTFPDLCWQIHGGRGGMKGLGYRWWWIKTILCFFKVLVAFSDIYWRLVLRRSKRLEWSSSLWWT